MKKSNVELYFGRGSEVWSHSYTLNLKSFIKFSKENGDIPKQFISALRTTINVNESCKSILKLTMNLNIQNVEYYFLFVESITNILAYTFSLSILSLSFSSFFFSLSSSTIFFNSSFFFSLSSFSFFFASRASAFSLFNLAFSKAVEKIRLRIIHRQKITHFLNVTKEPQIF